MRRALNKVMIGSSDLDVPVGDSQIDAIGREFEMRVN